MGFRIFSCTIPLGLAFLCLPTCDSAVVRPDFSPKLDETFSLVATDAAGADNHVNPWLSSGFRASVSRYIVPSYRCVRKGNVDWPLLPEAAEMPGEPTYFDVVTPTGGSSDDKPLLLHLHGSGLEFMEAIGVTAVKKYPDIARGIGIVQGDSAFDIEQTTQEWSRQTLDSSEKQPFMAVALERGYTVVFPANCWGDIGHGEGENAPGFYSAPRYGAWFDAEVWKHARKTLPHRADAEFDLSCSGGGHRTAEMLIRDPEAFDAVVVDSPADYLPGLTETPLPFLLSLAKSIMKSEYDSIIRNFFDAFFGGVEPARQWSLGTRIGEIPITVPIFLAYSEFDNFVTPPISGPLAAALQDPARYPAQKGRVWDTQQPVHCQINTVERSTDALDWLETSSGFR